MKNEDNSIGARSSAGNIQIIILMPSTLLVVQTKKQTSGLEINLSIAIASDERRGAFKPFSIILCVTYGIAFNVNVTHKQQISWHKQ